MTSISIPYFSLAESDTAFPSQQSWKEIKVPAVAQASPLANKERSPAQVALTQPVVVASKPPFTKSSESASGTTSAALSGLKSSSLSPRFQVDKSVSHQARVQPKIPLRQTCVDGAQPNQAIERLTNCILERFPLAAPTIVLFAGTQANPLISATCASVANALALKSVGEILLVDSSTVRQLSQNYQAAEQSGLSNLLMDSSLWKSALIKLPAAGLDFLPAGSSHWDHWGAESQLRQLAAEFRKKYQFVCVAADDPQHSNAKIWTTLCDGSFLLVSLTNANQCIAEAAVVELQTSGARLLGCVVTDADATMP